jgi:hypothetical protein
MALMMGCPPMASPACAVQGRQRRSVSSRTRQCKFDPLAERKKRDRIVSQVTMSSLRLSGLMVLAILAIAGLSFAILLLKQ